MAKRRGPRGTRGRRNKTLMRLDIENGVARVRECTAQEQEEFLRTHPNVSLPTYSSAEIWQLTHPHVELPTYSLEEVNRRVLQGLVELDKQLGKMPPKSQSAENQSTDPSTMSIGPSSK
jgi:hypothetical protein